MCKRFQSQEHGHPWNKMFRESFLLEFRINMHYASQQKMVHNAVKCFIVSVCILEVNKST